MNVKKILQLFILLKQITESEENINFHISKENHINVNNMMQIFIFFKGKQ